MTAKLFRNSMAVAVSVMALSIALFMGCRRHSAV